MNNAISAKKKKPLGVRMRKYSLHYLLILPGMLALIIFHYLPMFGVVIAFKNYSPYSGVAGIFTSEWVGFKHFKQFFQSYYFGNLMRNTLSMSLKLIIIGFPLSIVLALMINEVRSTVLKRTIQTISYMPHFLSAIVMAGLFRAFFATEGLVTTLLRNMGIGNFFFMGSPRLFVNTLIAMQIWQGLGWGTIIYLAAISGISQELYEAAIIDGASTFQKMRYITIPSIMPTIVLMLILRMGGILGGASRDLLLLLYSPSVYDMADTISTYVYRVGLQQNKYSFTAAVGLFESVVSMILIMGTNWIAKKADQPGLW